MSLNPGASLGSYQITARIGEGGMGEVYRAIDTTLGRAVAIKVLPDSFSSDPERLARFEREAKTLAFLNHPNIAQIYGFEKADGIRALIMELVEGPTLADRIAGGPIQLEEALQIARQIAEALEAAHDHGVIHRDLKPANVKVRTDGTAKVLDFGLAKALESAAIVSGASLSPTITSPAMTHAGIILGTAAYMSPEQARGKPLDRRADIWAFGCVLFEMLAGRRPFAEEESVSDTIAGVLKGEPDWGALPADTPPKVRALIERCLRKDVRRRLSHIAEARIAIEEPDTVAVAPLRPAARGRAWFLWPTTALVAVVAAAGLGVRLLLTPTPDAVLAEFAVFAPPGVIPMLASGRRIDVGEPISPDGRTVAFAATFEGQPTIWVRPLDSNESTPLPQTKGAMRPAWSPDGQFLAFLAGGQLKRVALTGGPAIPIVSTTGRDISWGSQNVILIGGEQGKPILRVSVDSGEVLPASALGTGETSHDYPQWLPDGRHFLYLARRGVDSAERNVYVGSLESSDRRLLRDIYTEARYSPTGHLLFGQDNALMAVPFDLDRLDLTGEPFVVTRGMQSQPRAVFSVSRNGTLTYLTEPAGTESQLAWFDRSGTQTAVLGQAGGHSRPRLSRDGRTVAFARAQDILIVDIEGGRTTKIVSTAGVDFSPVFSPDGDAIAFGSSREPATNAGVNNITAGHLYMKALGAAGDGEVLFRSDAGKTPTDWSRDRRFLAYTSGNDVWALPMPPSGMPPSGNAEPIQVTKTPFAETGGVFHPDGQWIAYQSNDSAAGQDVHIRSFPEGRTTYAVSVGGGSAPRWSSDGRELFYLSPDRWLTSVEVARAANELKIGKPDRLFESPAFRDPEYDVAGRDRFLLRVPLGEREDPSVVVIVNWAATIKQR